MSLCTQFWVLLPKARGQWACDTAVAVCCHPLGLALLQPPVPLFVPVSPKHVCISMPMSVCAHGHIHAWLQAIPLSSAVPSRASIGTGRALDVEQGSGSSGQLPPWQFSRESSCLAATSPWWCGGLGSQCHTAAGAAALFTPKAWARHPALGYQPVEAAPALHTHSGGSLPPSPCRLAGLPGMAPHLLGSTSAFPMPCSCCCTS